jgi:phosphoribosylformimino-5-aminoimidazole carboxamide ribotide isomerase
MQLIAHSTLIRQEESIEVGGANRAGFAVVPAVDIAGGEAVRLRRGDFRQVTLRAGDPRALVRRFAAGEPPFIHVVDLDGAVRGSTRPDLIRDLAAIAAPVPVQVAGGIRGIDDANQLIDAGAWRVVIGTAAFSTSGTLQEFVSSFGERVVVALDVRGETVRVGGWLKSSGLNLEEAARRCNEARVGRVLCTSIDRDGTLRGPDLTLLERVGRATGCRVLAAGGIRSRADIDRLAAMGLEGAIVGRALFEEGAHSLSL